MQKSRRLIRVVYKHTRTHNFNATPKGIEKESTRNNNAKQKKEGKDSRPFVQDRSVRNDDATVCRWWLRRFSYSPPRLFFWMMRLRDERQNDSHSFVRSDVDWHHERGVGGRAHGTEDSKISWRDVRK